MGVIFVVSPDYLPALCEEAEKYQTSVMAFGSVELALEGLDRVMISDVIGFAFLGSRLPQNLNQFCEFLKLIDQYETRVKFKFLLDRKDTTYKKINYNAFKNIDFYYASFDEVLTDQFVNKELFGSLLLDKFKPYRLGDSELKSSGGSVWVEEAHSIKMIGAECSLITQEVVFANSLKETLISDIGLQRLQARNSEVGIFRLLWVCKQMTLTQEDKKYLAQVLKEQKSPEEVLDSIKDVQLYCLCKSILEVVHFDYF